jgi:hypothetical protein
MTSTMTPPNTGVGVGPQNPAPANLGRSPMAAPGGAPAAASVIPFTRGSSDATMADAKRTYTFNQTDQVQLQTNAFLAALVLEFNVAVTGNSASVAFNADAPWNLINQIKLDDPAGQSIMAPLTGYQLYLLNKYLLDTGCNFDPRRDPNFLASTGTGATAGSISFRLVVPVEHRHRDAFGALNNSAANQRYLLTITTAASASVVYSTSPTTAPTSISMNIYQQYWTSPPAVIVTSQGQAQVQATPTGLSTVCFTRYERHNEVLGGGQPQIQFNNVGDYISGLIFVLRTSAGVRDQADWPTEFDFWVNDFQLHALSLTDWQRQMARLWNLWGSTFDAAGGLDTGVFVLPTLAGLFDESVNFGPANQYLPTDATTKLQIRGSTWGPSAGYLEVVTRMIRPSSGAALFGA